MVEITKILAAIQKGDPLAAEQLLPLVYDELRRLAAHKLAQEPAGQTLQATALVHEAYLRLAERESAHLWDGRRHFFAAAAEAMRRILVDRARQKRSLKGGGNLRRCDLPVDQVTGEPPPEGILALDEALKRLADQDPRKARLVELRYFTGLTGAEAAEVLDISVATAERDWAYARAWLHREIAGSEPREPDSRAPA